MEERFYWLGFSKCYGIGPTKFALLLKHFWTAENAWFATEQELKHCGIGKKATEILMQHRKSFVLESFVEQLEKQHIWFVTLAEKNYPKLLAEIKNAPFVLYGKGDLTLLSHKETFAVVGTRKITEYGKQVTETVVQDLSLAGCCIVSGLAMGVDAVAHAATVRDHGKTIAVLGSGVDYCTPQENAWLYKRLLEEGNTIISESPPGQMPNKGSFPSRNRIIAGISKGVLVTEGAQDSGSLITANFGLMYGRYVFAVPGPITSSVSRGPNVLISQGAHMVTSAKDILDILAIKTMSKRKTIKTATKEESDILDILQEEHVHFDEIVKRTGYPSAKVGVVLSLMEMKGWITIGENGQYRIVEL